MNWRKFFLSVFVVFCGILLYLYKEDKLNHDFLRLVHLMADEEKISDKGEEERIDDTTHGKGVEFVHDCPMDKKLFVYLSPVNSTMADNLHTLYGRLKNEIGPLRNHWYPVHSTLSHGFYDCEQNIAVYGNILDEIISKVSPTKKNVRMTAVRQGNSIYAIEVVAPQMIEIMKEFLRKTESQNGDILCNMVSNRNPYHITLAWQFSYLHQRKVEKMIREHVHLNDDVNWEVRLYEVIEVPLAMHNSKWITRRAWPLA